MPPRQRLLLPQPQMAAGSLHGAQDVCGLPRKSRAPANSRDHQIIRSGMRATRLAQRQVQSRFGPLHVRPSGLLRLAPMRRHEGGRPNQQPFLQHRAQHPPGSGFHTWESGVPPRIADCPAAATRPLRLPTSGLQSCKVASSRRFRGSTASFLPLLNKINKGTRCRIQQRICARLRHPGRPICTPSKERIIDE